MIRSFRLPRASAALLLLSACRPLVYTFDEAGMSQGFDSGSTTDSDPTDDHPTGPGDPASCHDDIFDNDELDVDCGGPCPPCSPEPQCKVDDDCGPFTKDPCARAVCTDGTCDLEPADDGELCDDDDACTDFSVCLGGACTGKPRTCDELAGPCRSPFCNPNTGNCAVEFDAPGSPCDDGLACSQFDSCDQSGACIGKSLQPTFFETFAMPQAWQTDMLWQIDVAIPSACDIPGSDDPAFDHSGDGFLAGLLIGGCTPFDEFAPTCLTSPPLDMLPGPEPIELRYWSQLSSVGSPMQATVELFDGQGWFPLQVFDTPVLEKQWTEHVFQLPMQPLLQVRFCQSQKSANMQSVGGWSIDDVSIGPPACGF